MRIIGLDYGDSKIGVAISDELQIIASPSHVIDSRRSKKQAVNEIAVLVKEYSSDTIVIGYPLNMDGSGGPRVDATEKFIDLIRKKIGNVKIVKWDERLTTRAAKITMRELGIKQKEKGADDVIAASLILQGYLDSRRSNQNG